MAMVVSNMMPPPCSTHAMLAPVALTQLAPSWPVPYMVICDDHGHNMMTRTEREIAAGDFKARCLKLMDEVQATRRPLVITKRGKPVARLVPVEEEPRTIFGCMKGTVTIHGDIISPIEQEWHAERGILYVGEDEDER
jgi:prevent-host-death family protein